MKKLVILSVFLLVISAALFAASARVFNQQLVLENEPANPDDALNYITNTGTTTSPNYILRVTANGETKGTDLGQAGQNMRIYRNTLSSQLRAIANFNQSLWTANWVVGSNLVIDIWWVNTPEGQGDGYGAYPQYKHVQKTWVVVSGSVVSQIDANAMVIPPYQPVVTDTWNYNLQFTAPAGDYTINGVGAPYLFTDHDDLEPNTLIGNYTISAAPAGFHWVENPIAVAAGDFILAGKADYIYNASKTFVLEADPVTDIPLDPSGTIPAPVGVVIVPIDPATDNVPAEILGIDILLAAHRYMITFTGIHDVVVYKPAEYLNEWWTWIVVGGVVVPAIPNPLGAAVPSYTFPNVNFDAKGDVKVYINDNEVLPVEFSSFAATLTAQNFVKLTWVTETETGVSGYNVYRSESADQASAVKINGTLIDATNTSSTSTYNHVDNAVSPETTYSYWLEVVEMDGTTSFHGPTTVYVETPASIVPSLVTTMGNAYPNPFKANTSTNIAYEVKAGETGTITIYNIIGQVVKTVPVKETTAPATFNWNGRDSKGNVCASGIYFYKMSTPSKNVTKKMVIVN